MAWPASPPEAPELPHAAAVYDSTDGWHLEPEPQATGGETAPTTGQGWPR